MGARAPAPGRLTDERSCRDHHRHPANLPALEAALARIEELGSSGLYCGKVLALGPHPNEVCALIAWRGIPTIYGNYDHRDRARPRGLRLSQYVTAHDRELGQRSVEWTLAHTEPAAKAFMRELPFNRRFLV